MKVVYLIYAKIPKLLYESKYRNLMYSECNYVLTPSKEYYIGLYAYTLDIKILNDFKKRRKEAWKGGVYKIKRIKFDREEYIIFKQKNKSYRLQYRILPTGKCASSTDLSYEFEDKTYKSLKDIPKETLKESISSKAEIKIVLCTQIEYEETRSIYVLQAYFNAGMPDYTIFQKPYLDAMDIIGYSTDFEKVLENFLDVYSVDDPYVNNRNDVMWSNLSYNVNPLGHTHYPTALESMYYNFILIFFEMIVGYKQDALVPTMKFIEC